MNLAVYHSPSAYVAAAIRRVNLSGQVVTCATPNIIERMDLGSPPVSIIVPTYREAANIRPLVERLFAALSAAGREAELILVDDDSPDDTQAVVEALVPEFAVRLVVRRGERGLATAVLRGFEEARYDRFIVLDADLQHPPEMVPVVAARLDQDDCDFVVGSRYARQGSVAKDWPLARRLVSRAAALLARPLAPWSDPMAGFFALRREIWQRADPLDPIGYKIALELYVKGRCRRPVEVPIRFAVRAAGESKADLREGLRFFRHLARLYRYRFPWLGWVLATGAAGLLAATVWIVRR